jgi:co-chaperonin GroES (HSP10)
MATSATKLPLEANNEQGEDSPAPAAIKLPSAADLSALGEVDKASQLPIPSGYKVLIMIPEVDEKTEGGIIKAAKTRADEETGTIVGFVMALGPDAYSDKSRFPSGPYCKIGDFIMMRAYSGTRLKIHGREFRILNDDSVEAIVKDPRGISKV